MRGQGRAKEGKLCSACPSQEVSIWSNIGALVIREGSGVYYTILIIRSPQSSIDNY